MEKFGAIMLFLIVCAAWGYSLGHNAKPLCHRGDPIMLCITGHVTGVKK